MNELDRETSTPLYLQVKAWMLAQIEAGTFRPHRRIPSERALSERFGISRMTVRQALLELIQEGRLYSRVGKGTFPADPPISQPIRGLTGFSEDMRSRGIVPSSRVLRAEIAAVPSESRHALRLRTGDPVLILQRLRLADGQPLTIEMAHLALPGLERLAAMDLSGSLYDVLRAEFSIVPASAEMEAVARRARTPEIALLDMPGDIAVLALERTTCDLAGTPFEHTTSVFRGDRYRFSMHLDLEGGE
ncbi:MAG: GntR family transcriptional regulator [Thermomicrobiales bacterium]